MPDGWHVTDVGGPSAEARHSCWYEDRAFAESEYVGDGRCWFGPADVVCAKEFCEFLVWRVAEDEGLCVWVVDVFSDGVDGAHEPLVGDRPEFCGLHLLDDFEVAAADVNADGVFVVVLVDHGPDFGGDDVPEFVGDMLAVLEEWWVEPSVVAAEDDECWFVCSGVCFAGEFLLCLFWCDSLCCGEDVPAFGAGDVVFV